MISRKGIWSKIYLIIGILGLLVPIQARAAQEDAAKPQQDTVTLWQENSAAALSVGISNAKDEKISTISVSLNVSVEGQGDASVSFDFDAGLKGSTEHDFIYNAGTGKMDIYVSSLQNQSLFGDGELKLGSVRVEPADASQVLEVEVSYLENSFQAANVSYGSKTPVISSPPEPVGFQVGAGVDYGNSGSVPDGGGSGGSSAGADGSSGGTGNSSQSSGGGSANQDNMSQGLYDETTRFVSNPADAKNISSTVIRESNIHPELIDMSKGTAAAIGGKSLSGAATAGGKQTGVSGSVSVVSPEDGPDSIMVGGSGGALGTAIDGMETEGISVPGSEGETNGITSRDGTGEIRLDKKNGGALQEKNSGKTKWIIASAVVIAGAAGGIGVFAFAPRKRKRKNRRKKKPVRRKRKKKI